METPNLPSLSDAIDEIGMGPFQSRLVLVCGMGWMFSAIEVLNIALVIDDIAETFQLGSFSKGLVGGIGFFGMLVGALFWSAYADKRGRRNAFILSLGCVVVAGLASALVGSVYMLLILRTFVGFGIGGNIPVSNVLVAEFLPTSHRATALSGVLGICWAAGFIGVALLALAVSRTVGSGREEDMWRCVLELSAVPGVLLLVASRHLPESPRFLSVAGRHDEGVKVLEEVARVNGVTNVFGVELSQLTTEQERVGLQIAPASVELTEAGNQAGAGGVRELFQTPIVRRATISIWSIWFFLDISTYGLTFLLPKYYGEISGSADSSGVKFTLITVLGVVFALASVLSPWVCAEDRLGRVGAMKWFSWAGVLLMLVMAVSYGTTWLFIPTSMVTYFVVEVPLVVKFTVTPELFSTNHRAVAIAGASIWTRIGGILAPILAEVLYEKGPIWPLAAFGPAMVLVAIFSGLIPFETAGRKLDDVSSGCGRKLAQPADETVRTRPSAT